MNAEERRFKLLQAGATRAMVAIGTDDLETLLATCGFLVTNLLCILPVEQRQAATTAWVRRLAVSMVEAELDDAPTRH